jgi:predicted TIM-barrel fold metal-dependent hydrolase
MRNNQSGRTGFWRAALAVCVAGVASLLALAGRLGPYQQAEQPLPQSVMDSHTHLAGLGKGSDCYVNPRLRDSWKFRIFLKAFGTTEQEIMEKGDWVTAERLSHAIAESQHVRCAVVLALDGAVDRDGALDRERTELYVPNEFVAEMAHSYTNLLWAGSVNPLRPDAMQRLEWCKTNGAVFIKLLPNVQGIDLADARFDPFFRKLVELGLPLLVHVGQERAFAASEDRLGDPMRLTRALDAGVVVIAAHLASTGEIDGESCELRLRRLMGKYPNLYADVSSLTQLNKQGYLGRAVRNSEYRGRLLMGSDWPLVNTALCHPLFWWFRLDLATMRSLLATDNPLDRDYLLKAALGLGGEDLAKGADGPFFRLKPVMDGRPRIHVSSSEPNPQSLLRQ